MRAVDLGETIDYLGLGFVDGNQWVVVYADVTNWSETDQQLDAASMTLVHRWWGDCSGCRQHAVDRVAPGTGAGEWKRRCMVPAGASIRVALVYSIPVSETELILSVDGNQLPLEDAVGRQFDVTDLSTIATPPARMSGTLRDVARRWQRAAPRSWSIPPMVRSRFSWLESSSRVRTDASLIGGEAARFSLDVGSTVPSGWRPIPP